MIFDCLCLMFFGKSKIILDTNIFEMMQNGYFQLNEEIMNFKDYYDEDYVYETYEDDLIKLSVPFKINDITGNKWSY